MELPSLAKELRKPLLWLTLACLSKNLDRKRINWQVKQELSLQNERGFNLKWVWLQNFIRFTCDNIPEPSFKKFCIRHWNPTSKGGKWSGELGLNPWNFHVPIRMQNRLVIWRNVNYVHTIHSTQPTAMESVARFQGRTLLWGKPICVQQSWRPYTR